MFVIVLGWLCGCCCFVEFCCVVGVPFQKDLLFYYNMIILIYNNTTFFYYHFIRSCSWLFDLALAFSVISKFCNLQFFFTTVGTRVGDSRVNFKPMIAINLLLMMSIVHSLRAQRTTPPPSTTRNPTPKQPTPPTPHPTPPLGIFSAIFFILH
jgi:hypothetical protein